MPKANSEKPSLMTLPPEVRLNILQYCLEGRYCMTEEWELGPEWLSAIDCKRRANIVMYTDNDDEWLTRYHEWMPRFSCRILPWRRQYECFPQVLRVCKKLHKEGREILYGHNKFVALEGRPACSKHEFMHTGLKASWGLYDPEYRKAFFGSKFEGVHSSEPAITFQIQAEYTARPDTHIVLLEDFAMAMSSLQYAAFATPRIPHGFVDRPLINMKINEVHPPDIVLETEPKLTTTFGDMLYPWVGRWLSSVQVGDEDVEYKMIVYEGDRRYEKPVHNTRRLTDGWFAYWQMNALVRQLEALRVIVEDSGPSKKIVQGLIFVVHQAKDAIRYLSAEWDNPDQGDSDPFLRFMATAAWRLAFLDISSIPNLSIPEAIAMKRTQTLYVCLAVHLDPPRPIESVDWKIQLQLRAAVLMHELLHHNSAELFLVDAVKADFKDRKPGADEMSAADVELELYTAVSESDVSLSVLAKGYNRRGLKPSDFPLLCTTWAKYRRNATLEPLIPETADAARPGNSAWCYHHPVGGR